MNPKVSPQGRRRKGVRFEGDIAKAFRAAGFDVRGLEGGGDLWAHRGGKIVHVETKRQERMKLPEWLEQMERDTPEGVESVLVFKQGLKPVYAVTRLDNYLGG